MSSATPRSAKVFCNGLPRRAETVVPWCVGARTRRSRGPKRGLRVSSWWRCRVAPHRHNSLSGLFHPAGRVPPMAEWTDPMTDADRRQALLDLLGVLAYGELIAVEHVRAAIIADPAVAGRLALWARRLVGEALVQAQRVAVDRDALARLIVGGTGDLAAVGELLARLTQRHAERMGALGLAA